MHDEQITQATGLLRQAQADLERALTLLGQPLPQATTVEQEGLLTTLEVAVRLGVHPRTIANWRREGCPHLRVSSQAYRYDLSAVRSWLGNRGSGDRG